ncbi:U2 snRNP component IST3 [Nannizzia gypsea CBS 118893]|uniref:U2 snRNP component IST3 n=1 Tax=Arthroderma gypseum (strain ATCC MYA-4604 / CBS 118893) TaxID=535722 RepID=E4UT45_ARTGP|nr:U2 snRNP component IST3 [Nannizzia gypsea CBS 118893]EFR01441.1 U2 snRNP component IST3 [Nannizzia gypsea CBS 118893]
MNAIRQIEALNKKELENAVSPEASWHADYRDTAYVYIGGLPFDISEGDILTIFSQYGNPVHLNLVRDKETGKSRGFAFLKYEDQRSTDLAVDNLGGATVLGRVLRVDHVRYKRRDDEGTEDNLANVDDNGEMRGSDKDAEEEKEKERRSGRRRSGRDESEDQKRPARPLLKEEVELQRLMDEHDEEDPMKEYLIKEKKEEVENALALVKAKSKSSRRDRDRDRSRDGHRSSHRHRHHRRRHSEERSRSRERRSPHRSRKERTRERSSERRHHRRERRDRS